METQGKFFDLDKTTADISKAYSSANRSAQITEGKSADASATNLEQGLATYGANALETGASKKAMANVFADMNANIANINNQYAIQKNAQIMSANQYFTGLASQGIIDSATGSFLQSTFNMNVELNEQNFRNQLKLLKEQGGMDENNAMWQGLGSLTGLGISLMTGNPAPAIAGATK